MELRSSIIPTKFRPHVCAVVTDAVSISFIKPWILAVQKIGWKVTVCVGSGQVDNAEQAEGLTVRQIGFPRQISLWEDLVGLLRMVQEMHELQPTLVVGGTPKAGLLSMISAFVLRIPAKIYWIHGLRFETTTGFQRRILILCERLACTAADKVICVSPSVRSCAIHAGLCPGRKLVVIGKGSSHGVDLARIAATRTNLEISARIRSDLGIAQEAHIIGFVGRIAKDKGIEELVRAFTLVHCIHPTTHLLLVGEKDSSDPILQSTFAAIESNPNIHSVGHITDVAPYYLSMTALCLPSHREGLPNVALEAASCGRPVVATRATGVVDAVVDGVTGFLSPVGDVDALTQNLIRVIENPKIAEDLGRAGRERMYEHFSHTEVIEGIVDSYFKLLMEKQAPFEMSE